MSDPFDLIGKNDLGGLRAVLSANPSLSRMRAVSGVSLLVHAAYMGNSEAVDIVRAAEPVLDPYEAIILGDAERVKDLLANRWDGNTLSPDGFPPLALAAFFGHEDVFDLLLPLTDDIDRQAENEQKVAAIHAATTKGHAGMVEKLLRGGADPNLKQAGGYTALQAAAANGDDRIVDLLRKAGADTKAVNDKGETAADLARSVGHEELAKRLAGR